MAKIFLFSEFNADKVLSYFHIENTSALTAKAMRHVFRMMVDEIDECHGKARRSSVAGDLAIEFLQIPYDLYRGHADNFYKGKATGDPDALLLACFAAEYVHSNVHQADGEFKAHGTFDDGLFERAAKLHTQAYSFWSSAEGTIADIPTRDVQFLAHIQAYTHLRDMDENHQILSFEEAETFLRITLPRILEISDRDTWLGTSLRDYGQQIEGVLVDELSKDAATNLRPKLSLLVTRPDPPENR